MVRTDKERIKQKEKLTGPAEKESKDGEPAFSHTNAACAAECTGLIQVPPESEDELKSYNDICSFTKNTAQIKK